MAENVDNRGIELRSEKVRNIVGQVPSLLLSKGITIITSVVILTFVGAYFIQYSETVQAKFILKEKGSDYYGEAFVPYAYLHKIKIGQKVHITLEGYPSSEFGLLIANIDSIQLQPIHFSNQQFFRVTTGYIQRQDFRTNHITYYPNMIGHATITYSKKSLLHKILPFLSIK